MKRLTIAMLLLSIGLAQAGEKKGPIEVGSAITSKKSFWVRSGNPMGQTEIKWKNLHTKPIQIIEFEVVYEHYTSGVAKTLKYTDVRTVPAEPKKGVASKFNENGIMSFNVQNVRPTKIFFTDGTRWLDKDQTATKPESEEYQELIAQSK